MTTTGFANFLAQGAHTLSFDALPPEAIHWAKVGILDTIGVTLAGHREDSTRVVQQALSPGVGPALILGTHKRASVLDAAMVNGTAAHALDFDDCNNTIGGHPSSPMVSALLPLAEQLGSSGRDFIGAYVAGFEVETKIAKAVHLHHYNKGWHPTGTIGTFGAAGACAKLLGLDASGIATALAIAASSASGIKANFGTMTKPLHVGQCARNGLYAAQLAGCGFTANADTVFEHKQGFLDVYNGPGTYDVQRAMDAWAKPLDIVAPGIAIKQYPCGGSTIPAVDALLEIVRAHRPSPDEVVRIDAAIHSRRLEHTNRPNPKSSLDGKFSVQYVLARAMVNGCIRIQDFEGDAYLEPQARRMLERVHMTAYDKTGQGDFSPDNHFGGMVSVTMSNGTVLRGRIEQPHGRTSANPLPHAMLREKFSLCAGLALRSESVPGLADAIDHLELLDRVSTMTDMIEAASLESSGGRML